MMGKYMVFIVVIVSMVAGCNPTNNETEENRIPGEKINPNTQQSTDEEQRIQHEPYKQYTQSEEKGIAKDGYKMQLFSSDEQREIEQHIIQMENVAYVHVEVYEDRLNIAVSVREGPYDKIEDDIYNYIQEHFPQRNIEILVTQITT